MTSIMPSGHPRIPILGELSLEDPWTARLAPEHLAIVAGALPGLAQLQARDMSDLSAGITDVNESFVRFKQRELQAWADEGYTPPSEELLVKPSGAITASIIHLMNQPSRTTRFLEGGEVTDPTNGCTAMVISSTYNSKHTLLTDLILHHKAKSKALEDYPESVRNAHAEYVSWLLEKNPAKIVVAYGQKVQNWILNHRDSKYEFTPFPLWGEFEGIVLFLQHESCCHNQQEGFEFRRAFIFCKHPERFFKESKTSDYTLYQSKCIDVAARIAGQCVPNIPRYYEEKKWRSCVPNFAEVTKITATSDLAELEGTAFMPDTHASAEEEEDLEEDTMFNKHPHSNDTLRELLPNAIKETEDSETEWQSVEDMPNLVLKWFKEQKQASFPNSIIKDLSGIPPAFETAYKYRLAGEQISHAVSVKSILLEIMLWQEHDLRFIHGKHQNLWHSRFDHVPIETHCMTCHAQGSDDEKSRWFVTVPGRLYSQTTDERLFLDRMSRQIQGLRTLEP